MSELWDIYDKDKKITGRVAERGVYEFKDGEYFLVVVAIIMNSKNEILVAKRSATKKVEPQKWELTGGGVRAGETSLQGILREVHEEIGLCFKPEDAIYFKGTLKESKPARFKDFWLFKKDTPIENVIFEDGEVSDAKWVTIEEFIEMKNDNKMISAIDFGMEEYKKVLEKINLENEKKDILM